MTAKWLCASLLACLFACAAADLRVPAFTAYSLPEPDGVGIWGRGGVSGWRDPATSVNWYGKFLRKGDITAAIVLRLPEGTSSKLKLTVGDRSRTVSATGAGEAGLTADFGSFRIGRTGYQRFKLESLNAAGVDAGVIEALELTGDALEGATFNLKPRRNAASVHLAYAVPEGARVEGFYSEVTGVTDPVATFYMATGWHRGYFGMQVNSATERRIIFSVWDSGGEAADRGRVKPEDRVQLVAKGEGVYTGDFGNEGTGGHSHLKFMWKTGAPQRFYLEARPVDATHTIYAGYYFHPDKKEWMLISAWKAPRDGGLLRGLHGFSENFGGGNGHLLRKSLHGNQWAKSADGQWLELTSARFSHDETGEADRLDRFTGVDKGRFFLSHGGFLDGYTTAGQRFTRPATGRPPADLRLPPLP